jgi:ketosteroid isomerase-like protein
MNNEQIVRRAYERAEKVDIKGWVDSFTSDGTFTDNSIGVTYRGPDGPNGLGKTVEVYAKAFPDMHRELYRFFNVGDVVVVELALQGTHKGPLATPMGVLPPTGKRMDAPCCDVFRIVDGKIQSFNCYPSGTVIFAQLGVLSNIEAAVTAAR